VILILLYLAFTHTEVWWANRTNQKAKDKIANTVANIANINAQVANLQLQDAEQRGELKKDVETLQTQTFGREDAKKETNAALANFNKALASNSNVNATQDDIQKALDKLDKQ